MLLLGVFWPDADCCDGGGVLLPDDASSSSTNSLGPPVHATISYLKPVNDLSSMLVLVHLRAGFPVRSSALRAAFVDTFEEPRVVELAAADDTVLILFNGVDGWPWDDLGVLDFLLLFDVAIGVELLLLLLLSVLVSWVRSFEESLRVTKTWWSSSRIGAGDEAVLIIEKLTVSGWWLYRRGGRVVVLSLLGWRLEIIFSSFGLISSFGFQSCKRLKVHRNVDAYVNFCQNTNTKGPNKELHSQTPFKQNRKDIHSFSFKKQL